MSVSKGRPGYAENTSKGDASPGDGFGNEIERMLMDRPMTRQSITGAPAPMSSGGPGNTLDELMAELGMLRGERGELSLPDRQLGRNGTRGGPRMSAAGDTPTSPSLLGTGTGTGGGLALGNGGLDGPQRPSTPRSTAAAAAAAAAGPGSSSAGAPGQLVLPPAKGALPACPPSASAASAASVASGPGRAQSPLACSSSGSSTRRSIAGALNGGTLGLPVSPVGPSGTAVPPSGLLERQAQLEGRLEKMEIREQQLMSLVSQLQLQLSSLSRAQRATQLQIQTNITAAAACAAAAAPPPPSPPPAAAAVAAALLVSDEDFIQDDDGDSVEASPRQRSPAAATGRGPAAPALLQQQSVQQRLDTPPPGAAAGGGGGGGGGGGRGNKLNPQPAAAPEWELDVRQLRKELGALGANLVRLRDQLSCLVPGGPAPLSEEVAAQAAAAAQLKHNLTQIAMDVVSLHKGLTSLKQNTERNHATLEKSINDIQLQAQTNALSALTAGPALGMTSAGGGGGGGVVVHGHSNAVAAALAATGGMSTSLEESLRSAFSKPAMRALPAFNTAEMGFMPDNAGAAAAAAAFGGGSGGRRGDCAPSDGGSGGGGLGAALALLSSFEEQAAAEQAEQLKAATIARQAVSIVDAKVKQVILHVDRHMHIISGDVEERLRMYEQTIIRMAQQIDRVQRVLRDIEGAATSRIVVQRGGRDVEEELAEAEAQRREREARPPEPEPQPSAKENWVKMAAMATGRFVPQKPEEKRSPTRNSPHGYFRTPP